MRYHSHLHTMIAPSRSNSEPKPTVKTSSGIIPKKPTSPSRYSRESSVDSSPLDFSPDIPKSVSPPAQVTDQHKPTTSSPSHHHHRRPESPPADDSASRSSPLKKRKRGPSDAADDEPAPKKSKGRPVEPPKSKGFDLETLQKGPSVKNRKTDAVQKDPTQ
jgi:hypothetical protein